METVQTKSLWKQFEALVPPSKLRPTPASLPYDAFAPTDVEEKAMLNLAVAYAGQSLDLEMQVVERNLQLQRSLLAGVRSQITSLEPFAASASQGTPAATNAGAGQTLVSGGRALESIDQRIASVRNQLVSDSQRLQEAIGVRQFAINNVFTQPGSKLRQAAQEVSLAGTSQIQVSQRITATQFGTSLTSGLIADINTHARAIACDTKPTGRLDTTYKPFEITGDDGDPIKSNFSSTSFSYNAVVGGSDVSPDGIVTSRNLQILKTTATDDDYYLAMAGTSQSQARGHSLLTQQLLAPRH